MRTRMGYFCLLLALGAGTAAAQVRTANYGQMYCSGVFSTESVPRDTYLISGEEARSQITFQQGHYVYINRGSGMKAGDEFLVTRPQKDRPPDWYRWKWSLQRAMGWLWKDMGKVRVVKIDGDVAIAQIVYSCDYFLRGDYVRPWVDRPAPALKPAKNFDHFAPASGRPTAQVVAAMEYAVQAGTNDIVYVNLGDSQGVKVGEYFRVFRYQGTRDELAYQHRGYQYKALPGFGKAPRAYSWKELPREVLGEGVVVRTGPNSSTVLITHSLREIYIGDYVELENPEPIVAEAPPAPAPAPTPNRSPTVSCAAEPNSVLAGERVRLSARASDPDGDPLTYAWRTNAGELMGSGSTVTLDTTGLRPGRYTVTSRVSDGTSAAADCTVDVNVQAAPTPAQAMKINECIFRTASAGVDNVCKRILDDVSTRLKGDPQSRLVIIGYADPAEAGAARLAGQRAENAKQYLLSSGIADTRVDVRAASGQEGAGRQNRRADLVWVPGGATY